MGSILVGNTYLICKIYIGSPYILPSNSMFHLWNVSRKKVKGLRDGGQVKSHIDLLKLCDDLRNVHMTLESANQLHEVDTQGTVNDVINRLPMYCREEWTKRAMMYRREPGADWE